MLASPRNGGGERVPQVPQQVLGLLETERYPDQSLVDASGSTLGERLQISGVLRRNSGARIQIG